MIEHILTNEQMNATKALADMSMRISEAKGVLINLKETEAKYIQEREGRALEQIESTLKECDSIIKKARDNYKEVEDFAKNVTFFGEELAKTFDRFEEFAKSFNENSIEWEKKISHQHDEIDALKKEILIDSVKIINSKKSLLSKEGSLKDLASHIESRQATLQKTYEIEKKIWNKIK